MRSFETWNYEEVEDAFGISPVRTLSNFEKWQKADDCEANETEKIKLNELRDLLFQEIHNWNSDELLMFSIVPILNTIDLYTPHFKPFTKRKLIIKQNDISASGKVDFMLAKGKVLPKIPYFCLHEYKQENRRDNDPLGQLLIGMVAAKIKNNDNLPIYGCYVSGRNWFFVLLEGDKYCVSNAHNASDDDIYKIFAIMKKCKLLVDIHAQRK
jgi:hypothetical protein